MNHIRSAQAIINGQANDFQYSGMVSPSCQPPLSRISPNNIGSPPSGSVFNDGFTSLQCITSPSQDACSGFYYPAGYVTDTQLTMKPIFCARVIVTSLVNVRYWAALANSLGNLFASDSPLYPFVGFRFSTSAGDTHLQAVSSNGSAMTVTSTGITLSANTKYDLSIDCSSGSSAVFSVNGSVVSTITTHLPSDTLSPELSVTALADGATRELDISGWSIQDN